MVLQCGKIHQPKETREERDRKTQRRLVNNLERALLALACDSPYAKYKALGRDMQAEWRKAHGLERLVN